MEISADGKNHIFDLSLDAEGGLGDVKYQGKSYDVKSFKYLYQSIISIYLQDAYVPGEDEKGEEYFRDLEAEVIRDISSKSCLIISTGGGAVLREENIRALKRNGRVFFIDADLSRLRATDDRPLSDTEDKLVKLYNERIDIYKRTADVVVPDMGSPEKEAEYILEKRMELVR
jgi:hypothetical protein